MLLKQRCTPLRLHKLSLLLVLVVVTTTPRPLGLMMMPNMLGFPMNHSRPSCQGIPVALEKALRRTKISGTALQLPIAR